MHLECAVLNMTAFVQQDLRQCINCVCMTEANNTITNQTCKYSAVHDLVTAQYVYRNPTIVTA
jgi:hypothetical protein